jgi:protocatechuate 3,4-dioxygenase beta subunit
MADGARDDRLFTRREALGALGALGVLVVAGCSSDSSSSAAKKPSGTRPAAAATSTTTRAPGSTTSCTLAPEVTQGPFYLTDHPNTANLVQDRPGVPLALTLTVVDTKCAPVANAKVDVWHCDAAGVYGGVGNPSSGGGPPGGGPGGGGGGGGGGDFGAATRANPATWLQGYQVAGADGTVHFSTIYPGWYPGRAVHIHMKVFAGGNAVHTGQLFFPDALSAGLFRRSPYRGDPDTANDADSIYRSAGSAALLAPATSGSGYAASAQLVVRD